MAAQRKQARRQKQPGIPTGNEDLRRGAAFHEAGHAVVARFLGLPVGKLEIAYDGSGGTEIGSADHLHRIDQIAVRLAGVAAQDLFGFSRPKAGYQDHAEITNLVEGLTGAESLTLRNAAYARAREIIKKPKIGS